MTTRPHTVHYIIEVFGVPHDRLQDHLALQPLVDNFVERAHLQVIARMHHDFPPHGCTILFVLTASHLAVHSWPEYNYVHLDLLMCKQHERPVDFPTIIGDCFHSHDFRITTIGVFDVY